MEQFLHTLGFLDTGEFEQDATGALQLLDVRSYHTKAVDTRAQYLIRIVNHVVHFLGEDVLHLFVSSTWGVANGGNLTEDLSQIASAQLLVLFAERCHIVVLCGTVLLHIGDGLVESFVVTVVSECAQNVGHRDLQGHVHTALQVKTES